MKTRKFKFEMRAKANDQLGHWNPRPKIIQSPTADHVLPTLVQPTGGGILQSCNYCDFLVQDKPRLSGSLPSVNSQVMYPRLMFRSWDISTYYSTAVMAMSTLPIVPLRFH
ncbi:hypothetical protein MYU51_007595 [Penicillium brevicompactum]